MEMIVSIPRKHPLYRNSRIDPAKRQQARELFKKNAVFLGYRVTYWLAVAHYGK